MKIFFFIFLTLISGCTANIYFEYQPPEAAMPAPTQKQTVYVTNPEHHDHELIAQAQLYAFSSDVTTRYKLTIDEGDVVQSLNSSLTLSFLTLGLLPAKYSRIRTVLYTIDDNGKTTQYEHVIESDVVSSVWERLAVKSTASYQTELVKALAVSERREVSLASDGKK